MFVPSVHGVLNPLALGAEIECDDDRVDGHEILADLVGARNEREHSRKSQRNDALDRHEGGQALDDFLVHTMTPFNRPTGREYPGGQETLSACV